MTHGSRESDSFIRKGLYSLKKQPVEWTFKLRLVPIIRLPQPPKEN